MADGTIEAEEGDLLTRRFIQQRPQAQFDDARRLCERELRRLTAVGTDAYLAELASRLTQQGRREAMALATRPP